MPGADAPQANPGLKLLGTLADIFVEIDDAVGIFLFHQRGSDEEIGGRPVVGDGDVVDLRNAQQRLDIRS